MTFAAALLLAMLARAPAGGAGETRDVRFEVSELSGAGASDLPVTLSALLAPGVFHDDDVAVVVRDGPGGGPAVVPAQIDVLSHHGDGSLQHALVTLRLGFKPHATHEVYLVPSPQNAVTGAFEAAGPDPTVMVELADKSGAHWTAPRAPPPADAPVEEARDAELRSGPVFGPLAQETARRARLRSGRASSATSRCACAGAAGRASRRRASTFRSRTARRPIRRPSPTTSSSPSSWSSPARARSPT